MTSDLGKRLAYTKAYYDFFQSVQEIACNSSNLSLVNMNDFLIEQIKNSTSSKCISNIILSHDESNKVENSSSNSYINKAQTNWEKKLLKSLNSLCTDFNIPLAKKRSLVEGQEIKRLWNELGTNVPDLKKFRAVFTINDFLVLQSVTGLLSIPIKIKSLHELKAQYKNLSVDYFQSGIDDNLNSIIEIERHKNGQKVVDINDAILSREFSKQGCTKSLRGKLWSQILNVSIDNLDIVYYNYLKQAVLDHDLLLDTIYYKDVKLTAVNDDQVFVFEDLLYQCLLVFSRDTHVLKCFEKNSIQVPRAFIKSKTNNDQYRQVNYPPNGFIPFDGFSMLGRLRNFIIASILGLCVLFENILQSKDPKLFFHLRKIEVQPLKIVFKWIMKAFSGFLLSSQLLELWDRILAFNSLEILSVFAAGVFLYRKQNLMLATNKSNLEAIMEDMTSLKVVAILQLVFV